MLFSEFAQYLKKLEDTSSRLQITEILAGLFKAAKVDEIDKVCYLSLGILAPSYKGIVFNIAEKLMLEAISKAYDTDLAKVKDEYKNLGDLGDLAEKLARGEKNTAKSNLLVSDVYEKLYNLAIDEGEKSVERKVGSMAELLQSVDPVGARFLARVPVGKLRLGFSDKTILDALSWMEAGDKSKNKNLEDVYVILPDVGALAAEVKKHGIEKAASKITPKVGVPILPMLAQRLKSPKEMIEKMGEVSVEPKFDGLRVLIHYKKKKFVKAFTRNLNDVTEMFPELSELEKYVSADEAIFDTEAVGMDPTMQKLLDFQTTMKRRRVHQIGLTAKEIPLSFQVFDLLMVDGKSLMDKGYLERRRELEKIVKSGNRLLVVDENIVTKDHKEITRLHKIFIGRGLEGVIVKKTDGKYVPGRTGWRWVKMKEEEGSIAKLSDTVDCVVMGYHKGRGKRAGFGLGGFLVGIRDREVVKTLTKIGTGLTDDQFRELKERLLKLEVKKKPKEYGKVDKTVEPDVWVTPSLVVEIAADEITKSPLHSSGYALRFPRLIKFRDDKSVDQSTLIGEIKKLHKLQKE